MLFTYGLITCRGKGFNSQDTAGNAVDRYPALLFSRSANLLRLADMLLARPVLTVPDAQQMLGVTYHTARNQIEKLVAVAILSPLEETNYGRLYSAGEILKILQ